MSASDLGYHDKFTGRVFREVGKKNAEVTHGRGRGKPLQISRKQLDLGRPARPRRPRR